MITIAATLAYSLEGPWRRLYLPGATTDGHYQIELACSSCHTEAFSDRDALQAACVRCHGAELAGANDSHPEKKFADPRNAERIEVLDARYCVTCHREHRPELTSKMGLSLPGDYCYRCHSDIASERPSHEGLAFDSCASGGCHNFHDNRALYEDFLAKHLGAPELVPDPRVSARHSPPSKPPPPADAPASVALAAEERAAWLDSAHASGEVNCTRCHAANPEREWRERVPDSVCADCHDGAWQGFVAGKHGMRLGAGLPALSVTQARSPMKDSAADLELGCSSCHRPHAFDTRRAAVDACLVCHDDQHSRAYRGSKHESAWLGDETGTSGASCATCHLPRSAGERVTVQHNQNDNLRPNEKMARDVCLACHGLGFTLDALADRSLIARNFRGRPSSKVGSLEMVSRRQPH